MSICLPASDCSQLGNARSQVLLRGGGTHRSFARSKHVLLCVNNLPGLLAHSLDHLWVTVPRADGANACTAKAPKPTPGCYSTGRSWKRVRAVWRCAAQAGAPPLVMSKYFWPSLVVTQEPRPDFAMISCGDTGRGAGLVTIRDGGRGYASAVPWYASSDCLV